MVAAEGQDERRGLQADDRVTGLLCPVAGSLEGPSAHPGPVARRPTAPPAVARICATRPPLAGGHTATGGPHVLGPSQNRQFRAVQEYSVGVRFLFMLTRSDRTVPDCVPLAEQALAAGVRDLGFKDAGADPSALADVVAAARSAGATLWLESVDLDRGAQAAELALELDVDHLLGGVDVDGMLQAAAGTSLSLLPFCGRPTGHPTVLEGSPGDVSRHCADLLARGVTGVDLLAWRATTAAPEALVRAARAALGSACLVVAGSIRTTEQIHWLAEAGVDAFTVGTAVLDGTLGPTVPDALATVLEAAALASGAPPPPSAV